MRAESRVVTKVPRMVSKLVVKRECKMVTLQALEKVEKLVECLVQSSDRKRVVL